MIYLYIMNGMNCIIFNNSFISVAFDVYFFSITSYHRIWLFVNTFFILASWQQYMCSLYEWRPYYKYLLFFVIIWCAFIRKMVLFLIFFFFYGTIFDYHLVTWITASEFFHLVIRIKIRNKPKKNKLLYTRYSIGYSYNNILVFYAPGRHEKRYCYLLLYNILFMYVI